MTDLGRATLPDLSPESFMIDLRIMQALEADPEIQQNFSAFPELYQRIKIDNIQRYGADVELFERRLEKLLTNTKANQLFGAWDDNSRLSDFKRTLNKHTEVNRLVYFLFVIPFVFAVAQSAFRVFSFLSLAQQLLLMNLALPRV